MAETDEFDMDIGDADFNIEGDDDDYYVAASHAPDPGDPLKNPRGDNNDDDDVVMRADFPEVAQRKNTLEHESAPLVDGNAGASHPVKADKLPENDDDGMDDEFDELLTQIDESKFTKTADSSKEPQPVVIDLAREESELQRASQKGNMPFSRPTPYVSRDVVASRKVPDRSPLKRNFTEISDFFTSQEDTSNILALKRSFPGPAGLLSNVPININDAKRRQVSKLTVCHTALDSPKPKNLGDPRRIQSRKKNAGSLKQTESEILVSNAAWRSMVKALNLNLKDNESVLHMMNISWLKGIARKFPRFVKVPLLILVVKEDLQEVSSKSKTMNCVKFVDHSGTIYGALDPTFLKAYGDKIAPGTTLALRNSRILVNGKHIVVAVLKNNVLCLSTSKEFEEDLLTPPSSDQFPSYRKDDSGIHLVQRGPLVFDEVLQDYHELLESLKTGKNDKEVSENLESRISRSNSLFTTVALKNNNKNQTKGSEPPKTTVADPNNAFFSSEHALANFTTDSSGFDDDDDEFLKALEGMDFDIEEDL